MDESSFDGDGLKRDDFGGRESMKTETADIVYIQSKQEGVIEQFTYPLYSDLYQEWLRFPTLFFELI